MDEHNIGMDPEVKIFFRKIMKTFAVGLLWILVMATAGLFFKLAIVKNGWRWSHTVFYAVFLLTLAGVIRLLLKIWRRREPAS